ncbi:DNA-directed DNA polymerase gamma mip1 [Yamadazyma tenuis]|uniref:DNA-directed DNA polymerase gamma mip1 n=1 Tax=Candida tenuis TaxID=2315449 RepID=UPI0027AB716F|nr:DNA-directed DNA polymerase gamma mip1 [Yamadazyma tenuis]
MLPSQTQRLGRLHTTRRLGASAKRCEQPRVNQLGIQYLSEGLHKKVFPKNPPKTYLKPNNQALVSIAKNHLKHHGLFGKKTQLYDPINIENFPNLVGNNTLDEHFFKIGLKSSEPYLGMCNEFFKEGSTLPPKPSKWVFKPGWYRYEENKEPEHVKYPLEPEIVFDVEVMYKRSPYAVIATAVTPKAWYGWVSPFLTNFAKDQTHDDWEHLIPMNTLKEEKLIVGHNVSYDRARILEEYNIHQSKAFFLDSMSLHIAVSGLCSNQRTLWQKHNKSATKINEAEDLEDLNEADGTGELPYIDYITEFTQDLEDNPWLSKGSPNSLASVANFHCGFKLDKQARDVFSTLEPMEIIEDFDNLMDYCSNDVNATFEVTKKLFPIFKEKAPHPVSFAALKPLGSLMLPTTKKWDNYLESAEHVYQENRDSVTNILKDRVNELVRFIDTGDEGSRPDIKNDPWIGQLDWTIKQPRLKKNGEPYAKQAYLTGYPEWYRELFKSPADSKAGQREMNISVRTRITPLLLKLKWEGHSIFWTDSNGWCFKVRYNEEEVRRIEAKNYIRAKLTEEDLEIYEEELQPTDNTWYELFKIPHPDGNSKRCTAIMSKSYSQYFQDGTLTSEYTYAQEILDLNSTASYWMGNRRRILEQFVVYSDPFQSKNIFFNTKKESKNHPDMGIILPKLVTMGTITRRATENTWLTASNAKKNRIGSELKSLVEAPEGYVIVGADVDSEELWIAALIGDSAFKVHGSTALSWMTLEGDKNHGTDLHSKTAEILGISRGDAKIFNYGRIYGAGVKFATTLLKQCNNKLSDKEAEAMAKKLYSETKGNIGNSKLLKRKLYHGGTESVMFNALESIAQFDDPRTPVLGSSITDALTAKNLNKNNFLTSRVNWAIQSSGVDYLHLLIVSMEYLINKYKLDARLMITVHDEVRYLVKEEDKYKSALLLQISNLWTRAMFVERLGFNELPQSVAFFSEVDIDKVLRKEVTLDCITPSQPNAIPSGESLDIYKLLEKLETSEVLKLSNSNDAIRKNDVNLQFKSNPKILEKLEGGLDNEMLAIKLQMEVATSKEDWRRNLFEFGKLQRQSHYNYFEPPKRITKMEEYDIVSDGSKDLEEIIGAKIKKQKKSEGTKKPLSNSENTKLPNKPLNKFLNKPLNKPTYKPFNKVLNTFMNKPMNKPLNKVLNKSTNEPLNKVLNTSTNKPLMNPLNEQHNDTFEQQSYPKSEMNDTLPETT